MHRPAILAALILSGGCLAAPVGAEPGDELLVRAPAREAVQSEVFYFVMPDRFDDGDASNNYGGSSSTGALETGFLPFNKGYYHGGDIPGLAGRLDYLDDLGITAIWMTPMFTNRWVQGGGSVGNSSAGYHGYWQIDYSSIDPHFGTNAEMVSFIDSANARGMKIFFDIVANHTGDVLTYVEGNGPGYVSKAAAPYRDASGNAFDDRDYAGTGTFPPLDASVSFPYTPAFASGADATVKSPTWMNDPIYYHNRGNSTFSGENSLYGDFFGLDDLFTEHPVVQEGLIDIFEGMVTDFGIDGFRVDTVKHVNDEFWEAFGPALASHAAAQGKPDFFSFGEVFDFNAAYLSRFSTKLPLDAVLDFPFQGRARNFASQSGATTNLANHYAADDYYTDADSNAYSLPLFLGNHDMGRIGLFLKQDNFAANDSELLARAELAYALMFFGRGMPVIYYGDEQGFVGDGGDKDARQDMMPSFVGSYNNDDLIGTDATTADANFDTAHPLYTMLADFSALLQAYPALAFGAQLQRYSEPSAGLFAFSRIERSERVEFIVALNNAEASDTATFATDSPNTSFAEVWPGGGPTLTADAGGQLTVALPPLAFRLYRANAPLALPASATGIAAGAPAGGMADSEGRIEITAALTDPGFAEVTFAVSVDGAPFEPIGTDDNAPYRVFHDISALAVGTPLAFKAIADNFSGALSSSTVLVSAGLPPDADGDGVVDVADNCIEVANPAQSDADGDGHGNACDGDFNNDCIVNTIDLGDFKAVFFTSNIEADLNSDGIVNAVDLGILRTLFFRAPGPSAGGLCD